MNTTAYTILLIGIFIGLIIGNERFRRTILGFLFKGNSQKYSAPSSNSGVKYYARDGGWHYHIRSCPMLSGNQFSELGYKEVSAEYILAHHLKEDACIDRRSKR